MVKIVKFGKTCVVCTVKGYLWVQGGYLSVLGGYLSGRVGGQDRWVGMSGGLVAQVGQESRSGRFGLVWSGLVWSGLV